MRVLLCMKCFCKTLLTISMGYQKPQLWAFHTSRKATRLLVRTFWKMAFAALNALWSYCGWRGKRNFPLCLQCFHNHKWALSIALPPLPRLVPTHFHGRRSLGSGLDLQQPRNFKLCVKWEPQITAPTRTRLGEFVLPSSSVSVQTIDTLFWVMAMGPDPARCWKPPKGQGGWALSGVLALRDAQKEKGIDKFNFALRSFISPPPLPDVLKGISPGWPFLQILF